MSINYRELRNELRIEDVLSWMSWSASQRVGDQLRGPCPFCERDITAATSAATPRAPRTFSVNVQRHIFRCFKCQVSGNALDLWSLHRQLPIYAAAREIRDRLHQNKQPPNRP
jgi:DNA primase